MSTIVRSLTSSAAVATLALTALSAPALAEKPKWASKSDATIVEFAIDASGVPFEFDANGDDFDILVAALIATGVVGIFDGTDYTVFAPNDQAFYDLTGTDNDADAFSAVVNLLGVGGIADVLAYDVTEGLRNRPARHRQPPGRRHGTRDRFLAAGLRRAQLHVRSQEQWKHPYYWAAWVLWGVGE